MNAFSTKITRRRALIGAAGVAGAASLSACTTEPAGPGDPVDNSGITYPAMIPNLPIPPDIEAASPYGYVGYLKFPESPAGAVDKKPLSGETITTMAALQAPAPAPMANNSWWQQINETLGGTLEMDFAPAADYPAKLSTLLASDNLPDLVQIPGALPNRADALSARFTELSEYLGGDKIAEYGQLANLTEEAWRGASFKGGIFGVPMPLGFVSSRVITREDRIKERGVSSQVNSADEFFELCTEVTDPGKNQWALGEAKNPSSYVLEMFGVPNAWRADDSGWVRDIETDEYAEVLEFYRKLWEAGVIHPDAFGTLNAVELYKGARILMLNAGGAGMVSTYNLYVDADPSIEMGMMVTPKSDGSGQAQKFLGSGIYTLTSIPAKVEPDRVRMLLHVLNTLGAAFGTQEYLSVQFGKEGSTWEHDSETGAPKATPKAQGEKLPVNYLPGCMAGGYFSAGYPEIVQTAMDYEKQIFQEEPVLSPTAGLYSATEANVSAELAAIVTDGVGAIIQGRKQVSDWAGVVDEWRSRGGDTIREEYQTAAAERDQG